MNNTKTIEEYRIVNDLREHQAPVQFYDLTPGIAFDYKGTLYLKPPGEFTEDSDYNAILLGGWKATRVDPYVYVIPVTMTINITP